MGSSVIGVLWFESKGSRMLGETSATTFMVPPRLILAAGVAVAAAGFGAAVAVGALLVAPVVGAAAGVKQYLASRRRFDIKAGYGEYELFRRFVREKQVCQTLLLPVIQGGNPAKLRLFFHQLFSIIYSESRHCVEKYPALLHLAAWPP